jgi:Mor family transcriptional regulator
MSEVEDMIRELTIACEEVLGVKMTDQQRVQVQQKVIQHFGGERVYVPKRAGFVMGDRFDLSGGVQDVMRRYQVSRRTAYRIVRGK